MSYGWCETCWTKLGPITKPGTSTEGSTERSVEEARRRAEAASSKSSPQPETSRPSEASIRPGVLVPPNNTSILSQAVDHDALADYTKWKYPDLPLNRKVHELLIKDLSNSHFATLRDVDRAVGAAADAVERYSKENPGFFGSGTDFITKSLGFVDKDFRARHGFSQRTREAFSMYDHLVRCEGRREA